MESVFNQDKIKDGEDNTLEIDINGKKIKKKSKIQEKIPKKRYFFLEYKFIILSLIISLKYFG